MESQLNKVILTQICIADRVHRKSLQELLQKVQQRHIQRVILSCYTGFDIWDLQKLTNEYELVESTSICNDM